MHCFLSMYSTCRGSEIRDMRLFSTVRNPFSRLVSSYNWLRKKEYDSKCEICRANGHTVRAGSANFTDFVHNLLPSLLFRVIVFLPQSHFVVDPETQKLAVPFQLSPKDSWDRLYTEEILSSAHSVATFWYPKKCT